MDLRFAEILRISGRSPDRMYEFFSTILRKIPDPPYMPPDLIEQAVLQPEYANKRLL